MSYFADEDVYRRFVMFVKHNYVLPFILAMEYTFASFFLLVIDQLIEPDHLAGGRFIQKALNHFF